jgi:hypothetical protein
MSSISDRLYIDKKDRPRYDKLNEIDILRFKDKGGTRTRREQFLIALSYGFKNKRKQKIKSREGFVLYKDLHPEDNSLIKCIAIYEEGDENILSDLKKVYTIAEEYAHAGIMLLCELIDSASHGTFERRIEKELFELYKNFKKGHNE